MRPPRTGTRPVPLIGVSACARTFDGRPFHAVNRKYVTAVVEGTGGQPVLIPPLGDDTEIALLLARLDGLLLTGSPSNVEPRHYRGATSRAGVLHDPARDATTLPLIPAAVEAGLPLLAICRGLQELNVAFGGTLHQHLQEVPGRDDHRMDRSLPTDERYGPRHEVALTPGGRLAALLGRTTITVNSLHEQAVDRIGRGLAVEAVAPDGTVEALSVEAAPGFAIGVQWHAEFRVPENPDSRRLFAAFGEAAIRRAESRRGA